MTKLTRQDLEMILTSLEYTKQAFQAYEHYPSYKFKLQRINDVKDVIDKIRALKRGE